MATSVVAICNRALQKLGADRITSLNEDSRNARSCNAAYESIRDSELRTHPWLFAIRRAELAADSEAPLGDDYDYQYTLPTDCLRILKPKNEAYLDWQIEGRNILSNETAPLTLRYIARITDPNVFDVEFVEAVAARLAAELCEELTQSNSKKAAAESDYEKAIKRARKTNAFESLSAEMPEDSWIAARR
jgi:hypothetical protein